MLFSTKCQGNEWGVSKGILFSLQSFYSISQKFSSQNHMEDQETVEILVGERERGIHIGETVVIYYHYWTNFLALQTSNSWLAATRNSKYHIIGMHIAVS